MFSITKIGNRKLFEQAEILLGSRWKRELTPQKSTETKQDHLSKNTLVIYAGLKAKEIKALRGRVSVYIVLTGIVSFLLKSLIAPGLLLILLFFEYQRLKLRAGKRAESFERDYTAMLLSLASAVKTGLDPLVALANSYELFQEDAELYHELKKIKDGMDEGLTEEVLVSRFGHTINHPDIQLFRTAFILARKEGSSLASCLRRLAKVTRQRQSFRRKTKAAVAMQKLSAFGIAACTVVIAVIQVASNSDAITEALEHPVGSKAISFGIGLIIFGLLWMLNMAKARV